MSASAVAGAMRRAALFLMVVLAVGGPVAGRASDGCGVIFDPVRDVHAAAAPDVPDVAGGSNAIDLTAVRMAYDEDSLIVSVGVRNVTAPANPGVYGATYQVTWLQGERTIAARAIRDGGTWTFLWDDGTNVGDAPGSIDRMASAIVIDVPLAGIGASAGDELTEVRATSVEQNRSVHVAAPLMADEAPNLDGGPGRFALAAACLTSTDGAGEACTVLRGAAPDTAAGSVDTPSTQIEDVRFTAADLTLVAEVRVADLEGASPNGERWEIAWSNPRFNEENETGLAWAERSGERVEFGYARGGTLASATGSLDLASDTIRVVVPRNDLRLLDGTRLEDVRATAYEVDGSVWQTRSVVPSDGGGAAWVVAPTCDAVPVQPCPVVLDRAGDARKLGVDESTPTNYGGLDLRAAGATPRTAEAVTLSARVADLAASDPPGSDVVGWTVSWLDGGRRVYAQAERYPEGVAFRYGAREAEGEAPAGPTFAGYRTTGAIDPATDTVSIDVPRALLPSDGIAVSGFGATAWALAGRNTAAVYLVWDSTGARAYQAGVACPA